MLAQFGIAASLVAMALTSAHRSLAVTAPFAVQLAFWTTTLEVAADAWRRELASTPEAQGPIVAANLWGCRSAMVAAGSGALIVADRSGWVIAYLLIALAAAAPLPVLAALPRWPKGEGRRLSALVLGLSASAAVIAAMLGLTAIVGSAALALAAHAGIDAATNVAPVVLALCLLPFIARALALPSIRRMRSHDHWRASAATGPYVDVFWRFGFGALGVQLFVSLYRMGDVLALTLAKPLVRSLGYSLTAIGLADGSSHSPPAWPASRSAAGWSRAGRCRLRLRRARWRRRRAISASSGSRTSLRARQSSISPPPPTSSATAWRARCSWSICPPW